MQSCEHLVVTNNLLEHAHHAAALTVGDGVEDLVYFLCARDGHGDGMGCIQPVELHGAQHHVRHEWLQVVLLGVQVVGGQGFSEGGETFVQPDVVPPLHGDQVAEPLVR